MRLPAVVLSFLIAIAPARAEEPAAPDFSGAWKRDCNNAYGLQIRRIAERAFAVAFCFPAGCNDHPWIAATPIAGDPKFRVVSETEIGVRRVDLPGTWLTYRRCWPDPAAWDLRQAGLDPAATSATPSP